MLTIDAADLAVVSIVGAGSCLLIGYFTGRHERTTEREQARRRRGRIHSVQLLDDYPAPGECKWDGCKAARLEHSGLCGAHDMRHRAPEPEYVGGLVDDGWYEDDEDQVPAPTDAPLSGRQRWGNGGTDHAVAMRASQWTLADETAILTDLAGQLAPGDAPGAEHHISPAMDTHVQEILNKARWGLLHGGELTAELTRTRVGMPTGQYPMVARTEAAERMMRVAAAAMARPELRELYAGGGR